MGQSIQEISLFRLDASRNAGHDLFASLIPSGLLKNRLSDISHLLHFLLSVRLDKTDLLAEVFAKLFQLGIDINRDLVHLLLPDSTVLLQLLICLHPKLCDVVLSFNAKPFQFADSLFTGLSVLDRPERGILLQLGIAHGVKRLELRNSGGAHFLKLANQLGIQTSR